jgi:hypothetical protein
MPFEPLWAAGNDWVVALATILIPAAIWVLNRVVAQFNQPGNQPPVERKRVHRPDQPGGPRDEVQEFLERVRERRRDAEGVEVLRPAAQPKPNPRQVQAKRTPRGQRDRASSPSPKQSPKQSPGPLSSPTSSTPAQRESLRSRIGEQVEHDIDTSDVTEHASYLTNLDQADEQMEAHIQGAFTHTLGQLKVSMPDEVTAEQEAERAKRRPFAATLREQLVSSSSVRMAVIWREILDRPTHRW